MSRTWGTFSRMTGWSVSRAAAMQGSAAFLAPLTRTVPSSGSPPRMTNLSMDESLQGYCSGECAGGLLIGRARAKAINHRGHWGHRGKSPPSTRSGQVFSQRTREMGHPLTLCYRDGLADVAFGFLQRGGGLRSLHAGGPHHDRDRGSIAGGFESLARRVVIGCGGLFEDADGALDEFLILGPNVDHEVAIDVAETGHGSGGDHVEHHFVGGARFHAGR